MKLNGLMVSLILFFGFGLGIAGISNGDYSDAEKFFLTFVVFLGVVFAGTLYFVIWVVSITEHYVIWKDGEPQNGIKVSIERGQVIDENSASELLKCTVTDLRFCPSEHAWKHHVSIKDNCYSTPIGKKELV